MLDWKRPPGEDRDDEEGRAELPAATFHLNVPMFRPTVTSYQQSRSLPALHWHPTAMLFSRCAQMGVPHVWHQLMSIFMGGRMRFPSEECRPAFFFGTRFFAARVPCAIRFEVQLRRTPFTGFTGATPFTGSPARVRHPRNTGPDRDGARALAPGRVT